MQTGRGQKIELGRGAWMCVFGGGRGWGAGGVEGLLLWKQPQGQTEHDQKPSDALQTQLEGGGKYPKKEKKKSLKRGQNKTVNFNQNGE